MNQVEKISELSEGFLICIDNDGDPFNGYIVDIINVDSGIITLILSHDGDFEENTFDVIFNEETDEIIDPTIFIL